MGFLKPHLPYVAPRKYFDLYDPASLSLPENQYHPRGAPEWTINKLPGRNWANFPATIDDAFLREYYRAYLACISYMDACTGRVLDAVDELGLRDSTIIVFLGDHGYQMGEHGSWGHKHSNYEISTRAPLLVAAPGQPAQGVGTSSLVEFLDLYPTLCDLAGLSIPVHVEGQSFAPLLDDPSAKIHQAVFSEMRRGQRLGRTIRTETHRYVEWTTSNGRVVATELYDETADPQENVNIMLPKAGTPLARRLAEQLNERLPREEAHRHEFRR